MVDGSDMVSGVRGLNGVTRIARRSIPTGNLRFSLVGHDRRACRVTLGVSLVAIRYIGALSLGFRDAFCLEDVEWRNSDCPAVNPYRQPSVFVG
jgi:hypothetical protein